MAATAPVAWSMTIEIRPFASEPRLDEKAAAFGRFEDGAARPYAAGVGRAATQAPPSDDQAVLVKKETPGGKTGSRPRPTYPGRKTLERAETPSPRSASATGKPCWPTARSSPPARYIAAIDVVSCADQEQAIQLAAAHPAARYHPIEVRPFENE